MLTEQELISKLQELKQIKPRKEWVVLAKMDILGSDTLQRNVVTQPAYQWNFSRILEAFSQRKFAYALAVLLFVFAGVAGALKYQMPGTKTPDVVKVAAVTSQADMLAENTLKSNVEDFKLKSQNLAEAVKNKSQDPVVAIKEVKDAANNITNELQKNPELAKVIALDVNNNRSLLDIPGGDNLKEVSDVYKTLDKQMIDDLDKTTLTPAQKDELDRIKASFNAGKDYATVLRDILFLNASENSTKDNK